MPSFGGRSTTALDTVEPRLVRVLDEAIKHFDFSVLEGHRGEVAQNKAHDEGKSNRLWPTGSHNSMPSRAVDVAPWRKTEPHINWQDVESFIYLAGFIVAIGAMMGVKLRSGGDWDGDRELADEKGLRDFGHIELDED